MLLEFVDSYIEDVDNLKLIDKNRIAVDPLADEGQRIAYEVIFQSSPEDGVTFITTFTYSDNYLYVLLFACPSEYYSTLLPAYNQLIESVRFR